MYFSEINTKFCIDTSAYNLDKKNYPPFKTISEHSKLLEKLLKHVKRFYRFTYLSLLYPIFFLTMCYIKNKYLNVKEGYAQIAIIYQRSI